MIRLRGLFRDALRLATTLVAMTHFIARNPAVGGSEVAGYLRDKAGNVLYPFTSQHKRRRHQQSDENLDSGIKRHHDLKEHRYSYPSATAGTSLSGTATGGGLGATKKNSFSSQQQLQPSGFPADFFPQDFSSPFWSSTATVVPPASTSPMSQQSIITSPTLSDIELYQQLLLQQQMYPQQSVVFDSYPEPSRRVFKRLKKKKKPKKNKRKKGSLLGKLFNKKKKKKESEISGSGYGIDDDDDDDDDDDTDDDKYSASSGGLSSSVGKKSKLLDAPPIPCSKALGLLGMLGLAHYLQSIIHGVSSKSVHSALHYPDDMTLEFLSSTYSPPVMLSDYVHRSTSSAELTASGNKQRLAEVLGAMLGEKRSASSLLQMMKSWAGISPQQGSLTNGSVKKEKIEA